MQKHEREIVKGARKMGLHDAHVLHRGTAHPWLYASVAGRVLARPISCSPQNADQHVKHVLGDLRKWVKGARRS